MVEFVARRARQVKLGKVYPYAAVTKGCEGKELAEIGLLKAAGAVAFTDGERAWPTPACMRRALSYAAGFDALIVQHPEEPALAEHGVMNEGRWRRASASPGSRRRPRRSWSSATCACSS